jgi:uncharacterized delta-60 repeat protein
MLSIKDNCFFISRKAGQYLIIAVSLFTTQLAQGQCPMPANTPAGTLDTCFTQTGTGLNNAVFTLALQPDGKVLAGGFFDSYNGTTRSRICRLNADGTLDASFASTGTGLNDIVNELALQPDGKVLVVGRFNTYSDSSRNYICRLNTDGSLDATFAPTGLGLNGLVYAIALQPDGKVLLGGRFTSYNGSTSNRICRLNANGTLDATFAPTGAGLNDWVFSLALQPDGKIVVGGDFTSYNGTIQNRICRLNSDGSQDATFTAIGLGFNNTVFTLAIQPDGKILVGGRFTTYNGNTQNYICRLNANGSRDANFTPVGAGLNNWVFKLALQLDGKVVVGGDFTAYDGTIQRRIVRLNSNGAFDSSFAQTGTGLDFGVRALAIQPDGKVMVGGNFGFFSGKPVTFLARFFATDAIVATKPIAASEITLYPNPAQTHITLQNEVAMPYKLVSTTGVVWQEGIAQPKASIPVASLPHGVYSLVLTHGQSVTVKHFVKE